MVLPEVFLKAVAIARNEGRSLDGLTTVNLDFLRHYRPLTNVVSRPTAGTGRGYLTDGTSRIADSAARRGPDRSSVRLAGCKAETFEVRARLR